MDNVIDVLDYLSDKIGIAIDWGSENVYPQVVNFMKDYRLYSIVTDSISVVLSIAFIMFAAWFAIEKILPMYDSCKTNHEDNKLFTHGISNVYMTDLMIAILVVGSIASCVAMGIIAANVPDLLKWIFIPEYNFYQEICKLVN